MTAPRSHRRVAWTAALALLLAGCGSGGPVRRISEPAASIQQLTVRADGSWEVQVRLNNFSNVPMRFTATNIQVAFDNGAAATVQAQPQIVVGPESADVATAMVSPLPEGRARVATALADGRSLNYALGGTVDAGPEDGKPRTYKITLNSALTPVPGLPGVLR
jgi:hypothetical protein